MRNVVVTGGSRGLGFGVAHKLAASGFRVIVVARTQSDALRAAIGDAEDMLHFRPCDLSDTDGIGALAKTLHAEFGALYGLVNNAAMGDAAILANMPDRAIERQVRLNVISPMLLTKHVLRSMMKKQGGRIVNMASVVAFTGYKGLSVYSATKASLLGFTRSLAREVGPLGITVNAVAPGFMDTEMTHDLTAAQREKIARRSALGRMAEIEDVAEAVDFLLADKARNITGTVITVDAGNTA